jgi:hypothetical protein
MITQHVKPKPVAQNALKYKVSKRFRWLFGAVKTQVPQENIDLEWAQREQTGGM